MNKMASLVGKGFQPSKCKTQLRLGSSRIKLLRNKKSIQIAADRKVVADLLRNGQESNARLQVEHIIREQNLIEAYDLLYLYAERIAAQLPVIDSLKTCPPDLKEDISSLLYASSRCAELPDFAQIRPMFIAKYGKEFVTTIDELRPGCGVNGRVIEKLSVSRASGEAKLQLMKNIAAEHTVEWDAAPFEKELRAGPQDLLEGPSKIISVEDIDEFPTVPSQKPILTQSDHFANSTSGRFMEEKVEQKNSPRPVGDFRTSSQNGRTGPPARKPPGLSAEDPPFDSDMNPGARETLSARSSRRESDSFAASRRQEEESRRKSIGVPREKTGRVNTVIGGIDEGEFSPPREYSKHNRRGSIDEVDGSHRAERRQSQKYDDKKHSSSESPPREYSKHNRRGSIDEVDGSHRAERRQSQKYDGKRHSSSESPPREYSKHNRRGSIGEVDGSHRAERRQSQKYDGMKHSSSEDEHGGFANFRPGADAGRRSQEETVSGSGKPRSHKQDPDRDEGYYRKVPSREKARDREPGEPGLRKPPSREGSGKGRTHDEVQCADEQILRKAPSREGSGKGRAHHDDQYVDEPNLRRASSKEGSGSKIPYSSGEEGRRSKEGSQYAGKYQRHDSPDEDAVPEPPRQRDSRKNAAPKFLDDDVHDPDWDSEHFKKSVTTRTPRNPEDEYRESPRGTRRESGNWKAGVSEDEYRDSPRGTRRESGNWKAGVSEDANRDSPRGTRRESGNWKAGVSPRGDYSPRAYDTVRRPYADDTKRSNLSGRRKENERSTSETLHHDSSEYEDDPRGQGGGSRKNNFHTDRSSESGEEGSSRSRQRTPRLPSVDELRKDAQEGSSKGRRHGREDPAPCDNDESLTTTSRTEKRMSLPGEKPKYRSSDAYDDTGRRATMGPAEITRGARESEDFLPRREKQKPSDRRQSAPLPKDDAVEGRQSSSYAPQRDRPSGQDEVRPPRFLNRKVDNEHSPRRERPERPRKKALPEYDDNNPPPRFINVGKQDDRDSLKPSTSSTPRSTRQGATLQSHNTDPELPKTPKVPEHRKSQSESATEPTTQPPSKPAFIKPPDLDVFLGIFGDRAGKWK